MTREDPLDLVRRRLATYLGANTAATAVRTFSKRALGRAPEELTAADLPALLEALHPMLRTLLGSSQADLLLAAIRKDLS